MAACYAQISEVALLDEAYHLQGLVSDTELLTENPDTLPEASVLVVNGLQLDINRLFREVSCRDLRVCVEYPYVIKQTGLQGPICVCVHAYMYILCQRENVLDRQTEKDKMSFMC